MKLITKVTIHPDGLIVWKPPAIYKSLCPIDVEYFPFDEQQCTIKIGSWTYHEYAVKIIHKSLRPPDDVDDLQMIEKGINLDDYYKSTEWDLLAVRFANYSGRLAKSDSLRVLRLMFFNISGALQRDISELPRPMAVKLWHMIGYVSLDNLGPKIWVVFFKFSREIS